MKLIYLRSNDKCFYILVFLSLMFVKSSNTIALYYRIAIRIFLIYFTFQILHIYTLIICVCKVTLTLNSVKKKLISLFIISNI